MTFQLHHCEHKTTRNVIIQQTVGEHVRPHTGLAGQMKPTIQNYYQNVSITECNSTHLSTPYTT